MAHIAHQPGPVCLEGGVSRWLVRVVGLGGGAAKAPTGGAWGASVIRVSKKNARCPGLRELLPRAMRGVAGLRPLFPGGGGGRKAVGFHNPPALSNVEEEGLSCARDQVVITRPPVLTPPWRHRRSLVSKGRFAISINVICVGICSSLPKRRYRVAIDYVGALLRHRGRAWCWLFRGF
jgi:hypothetical protein